MEYGLQLYSIRDLAERDLAAAVKKAAELGYKNMEFAGFFGHSPEEVNEMLRANGVRVSGTHSPFDDLIQDFDATLSFHKAIGNRHYIVPGYKLSNQARLDQFVAQVNAVLPRLKAEGITLSFHNHAKEFIPNIDGSVAFEQLLYRTALCFEVDTYWAFVGMKDPLALLERVKDRLICIHIKDGSADGHGVPLGMGEAPVKDVWQYARERDIPMVVESETCNPSGPAEAEVCMRYLRSLEK